MAEHDRFVALARQPFRSMRRSSRGFAGSIEAIRDTVRRRELLGLLVRRDLKSRYKDSALGFAWVLARPLTQLAIYYVVIGKFLGASRGIPDFAIYVFCGLTAYGFFSEIVNSATGSIIYNAGLIKKIYMPRELFPLASVGSAAFNLVMQMGILLLATALLGAFPTGLQLLYGVAALAVLTIFGTALGLLLSAANVYLRDIQYLVEVILLIMLWASPIVYSWGQAQSVLEGGALLETYTNSPVTLAVLGFQQAFWVAGRDVAPYPDLLPLRLGVAFLVGVVVLFLCHRAFIRLQGNFAQLV